MVRFEKDRYVIEIYTGGDPIESYQELHKEIACLFGLINQENILTDGFPYMAGLLENMQPDWEVAKRMIE